VISTEEAIRPSTRLKTMLAADLLSISQHQRADPSKLIRDVRGDVDWIVMKALEKDRARRYGHSTWTGAGRAALSGRRKVSQRVLQANCINFKGGSA